MLGDSLELMKQIEDGSIDMIFTDLPFGTTKNHWDKVIDYALLWEQYKRIIKDNGAIVLFAQSPFDKILACSNLEMYRYEWIWEKSSATGFLNAQKMPLKAHENILVFYKKLPTYNPQKTKGHKKKESLASSQRKGRKSNNYGEQTNPKDYCSDERYPRSVLKFKTDKQKIALHPTQKPLELIKYMIKTYTNKGDIVLDNCVGSGTTAIGCIQLERKYIAMELCPEFHAVAQKRIDEAYGNVGLFEKLQESKKGEVLL